MTKANTFDSYWAKVEPSGFCWYWRGTLTNEGYGHYSIAGASSVLVHRIAYEHLVGGLDGLQIDHLCKTRGCVNPDHLDPVTAEEHARRTNARRVNAPLCVNGHERTDNNLLSLGEYTRCRQCVLVRTHLKRGRICSYDRFCDAESHRYVMNRRLPAPRKTA